MINLAISTETRNCDFCSLGCGANFTSTSGRVVSPNYPADYPDESNCNYIIDAGEQTVVLVTFQIFQVEGKYLGSRHCVDNMQMCKKYCITYSISAVLLL